MKCPRDGTELDQVVVGDVELDKCHKCDGIWCDRGELERIRKMDITDVEELLEKEYGNPEPRTGKTDGFMQCPRCDGRLQGVYYMLGSSIRIDRCEECLGFWLDDNELDGLTRRPKKKIQEEADAGKLPGLLRTISKWFQGS